MSVENKSNVRVIPTLEVYDNEVHSLDHLHIKLFKQLEVNTNEIKKLNQFRRKVEQNKEWLVKYNSKGVSTLGLGQYKCAARKKADAKIEKCLTWLIMKYNKMFRCFLSKTEKAIIKKELEEYKIVKNEVTKSRREIPVRNENGTEKNGKKIKIKVLKTPQEIARELKLNGGITVSEEAVDVITQKKSCCVCKCCDKDKKGNRKTVSIQMNNLKENVLKTVKKTTYVAPLV